MISRREMANLTHSHTKKEKFEVTTEISNHVFTFILAEKKNARITKNLLPPAWYPGVTSGNFNRQKRRKTKQYNKKQNNKETTKTTKTSSAKELLLTHLFIHNDYGTGYIPCACHNSMLIC